MSRPSMTQGVKVWVALAALVFSIGAPGVLARQPNPKEMSGVPLPVGDVPNGTVVVRVIRGSLANNIPDQPVELMVAGRPQTASTDATGRATFSGLTPGTRVTASTTVAGEQLKSQEFPVPASGGVRLLLVATDPNAQAAPAPGQQAATAPAQTGSVALGEQSRFVFEFADASISVFNILQLVNTAGAPVQPLQPVIFDLPTGATGTTILQDSSPQATANGARVTVIGPFAPGTTLVQFAYSMPYSGANLEIAQKMPTALSRVLVLAQKSGEMRLTSAQMTEQREMNAEGHTYVVGQGPGLKAGDVITFQFSGLPHAPTWPRNLTLALAVVILLAGAWASRRTATLPASDRARTRLEAKRAQLFDDLTSLELQHKEGRVDPSRYAARRLELVAALERVFAEIDRQAA